VETTKPKYFRAIAVLNLIGVALSLYSLHHHIALEYGLQTEPSFCNISATFNCDAVNASEWSTILGLPIASYGLAFYSLFGLFALLALKPTRVPTEIATAVASTLSVGAVGFSVYLFAISKFVIGTICLVCVSLYLLNILLLWLSYRSGRPLSFLAQLGTGLPALLKLPFLALGLGRFSRSQYKNSACGWSILGLALGIILVTQPQRAILATVDLKSLTPFDEESAARAALEHWKSSTPIAISENTATGPSHDYAKGPSDAPITIIEFSDFECPACRRFYADLKEIVGAYSGKVRAIHRNFPIDQTCNVNIPQPAHVNACYAALFTRCAGEQGKFWEATDYIFSLPAIDAGAPPETVAADINAGIAALDLDEVGMNECLSAERQKQRIIEDIDEAVTLGLQATPTVWINNRPVLGVTKQNLTTIIDHILAEQQKSAP